MKTIQELLEQELQAIIHTSLQPHMGEIKDQAVARVDTMIESIIAERLKTVNFEPGAIDPSAIDISKLRISKEQISDLVEPQGIEDIANSVQLTVMNDEVVIENTLYVNNITSKVFSAEHLSVDDVDKTKKWYTDLKQEVLDVIPIPDKPKDWSFKIAEMDARIDVNAKRSGQLKELEVSGEAMLSDVLYTTPGNKRVGINTMEPSDALTVWDQEAEVVIGKHASQEGYIGTRRRQDLNIGANNNVGIKVKSDGTVSINKLDLMGRTISQSKTTPGHAAKTGDIVLNSKPTVGSYIGWVCLDGLKWSGFGKIE